MKSIIIDEVAKLALFNVEQAESVCFIASFIHFTIRMKLHTRTVIAHPVLNLWKDCLE